MLTPWSVALIVVLVLFARTILTNLRLREQANDIARLHCERSGLQLLDGTVALESMRLVRSGAKWGIRRSYRFDYTTQATDRHRGTLLLLGDQLESLIMREELVFPGVGET